jgi:hypothetical protein
MREFIKHFIEIEKRIAQERGAFTFFGLFQRNAFPGRWDVVVAAPWIGSQFGEVHRYFADRLKAELSKEDFLKLARIAPIVPDNPRLEDIHEEFQVEHGTIEVWNRELFGVEIRHAYIITSQRLNVGAEAVAA